MSMMLSRRELLAATIAAAPTVGAPPARPLQRGAAKKVVVLGAGLAGLSAAYELDRAGHEVTVLEARLRAGGRVYTLREPFSDGLYAEAGALFIPSNHGYPIGYARQFGLTLERTMPRTSPELYYVRGKRVLVREGAAQNWPLELTAEERRIGYTGLWQKYILPVTESITEPASAEWPPERLKPLDQMTLGDFLRSRGASPGAVDLLRLGYFELWGDGIDAVSALSVLRDVAQKRDEKETFSIRGGNDQLPKAFASKLKTRTRYGAAILKIEPGPDKVQVTYRQGGENFRVAGDHVICTLPFSTLRQVEIAPQLSARKMAAIQQLPYTSVARVFLQCRTKFWKDDGYNGSGTTDLPIMWTWDPTLNQAGPRGILESYMAGPQARRVTAMKEADRLAYTLEQMDKVYPGARENYEGGVSKCWDEDEWSRGDYVWFKPGQQTEHWQAAGKAEGRIHFAGEHTSAWPGWMQGALDSGVRCAREVNEGG